jgi:hypothetical protein
MVELFLLGSEDSLYKFHIMVRNWVHHTHTHHPNFLKVQHEPVSDQKAYIHGIMQMCDDTEFIC